MKKCPDCQREKQSKDRFFAGFGTAMLLGFGTSWLGIESGPFVAVLGFPLGALWVLRKQRKEINSHTSVPHESLER